MNSDISEPDKVCSARDTSYDSGLPPSIAQFYPTVVTQTYSSDFLLAYQAEAKQEEPTKPEKKEIAAEPEVIPSTSTFTKPNVEESNLVVSSSLSEEEPEKQPEEPKEPIEDAVTSEAQDAESDLFTPRSPTPPICYDDGKEKATPKEETVSIATSVVSEFSNVEQLRRFWNQRYSSRDEHCQRRGYSSEAEPPAIRTRYKPSMEDLRSLRKDKPTLNKYDSETAVLPHFARRRVSPDVWLSVEGKSVESGKYPRDAKPEEFLDAERVQPVVNPPEAEKSEESQSKQFIDRSDAKPTHLEEGAAYVELMKAPPDEDEEIDEDESESSLSEEDYSMTATKVVGKVTHEEPPSMADFAGDSPATTTSPEQPDSTVTSTVKEIELLSQAATPRTVAEETLVDKKRKAEKIELTEMDRGQSCSIISDEFVGSRKDVPLTKKPSKNLAPEPSPAVLVSLCQRSDAITAVPFPQIGGSLSDGETSDDDDVLGFGVVTSIHNAENSKHNAPQPSIMSKVSEGHSIGDLPSLQEMKGSVSKNNFI